MSRMFPPAERSQRNIRIVLFIIILATLPFYCIGFFLWGTAPAATVRATATPTLTFTPLAVDETPLATATDGPPVLVTATVTGEPLQPTPNPIIPGIPVNPTRFLSPTPFGVTPIIIPTVTPTEFVPATLPPPPPPSGATATTIPIFPGG